jgi:oligosaccharide repeat unit polymerase
MLAVSVICLFVVLFLVLETTIRKTDFFSPIRLYLFFHATTLGIAFLAFDRLMSPFHPFTWLVYLGSGICYVAGVSSMNILMGLKGYRTVKPLDLEAYQWKRHFLLSLFLFVLFVWGMLYAFHGAGEFPLLSKHKLVILKRFFAVNWTASMMLSQGGVVMALFFMALFRRDRLPIVLRISFWLLIGTGVFFAYALSRVGFMFFAIFALVFYHQAIRRISMIKLTSFFMLILSAFLVTSYLKIAEIGEKYSLDLTSPKALKFALRMPYNYVANNYWNLDHALNPENYRDRHPTTYGFSQASGLLDMIVLPGGNLGPSLREGGGYEDPMHTPSIKRQGLNTITYQWGLYKDFGLAGVFVLPYLFGAAFSFLYWRVRKVPTVLNAAVYSYLAFVVSFSWFSAMWELASFVFGFIYLTVCCFLCQWVFSGRTPQGPVRTPG